MVDTNTVIFAPCLLEASGDEAFDCIRLARIQNRVVPWLALGIGPAGWRSEAIIGKKDSLPAPCIAIREADLEVAPEFEPKPPSEFSSCPVLLVKHELPKGVALDRVGMPS